jgi:uncharacterized tellurite resistance protein B-like protein
MLCNKYLKQQGDLYMRNLIKSILKKTAPNSRPASSQKGASETELHIATCAVLLEIAHADDEFSPDEEQRIEELMQKHFNLPAETVQEIKEVSEKRRKHSIDLWQFTNTIKENYSPEQKEKVIEMIWSVIYADSNLDMHEDYLAHKLAKLLGLAHKQLIAAKVKILKDVKQQS